MYLVPWTEQNHPFKNEVATLLTGIAVPSSGESEGITARCEFDCVKFEAAQRCHRAVVD